MAAVRENQALNAIRTIAALIVVVGHVRSNLLLPREALGGDRVSEVLYALTSLGNGAVMVFFVLSGYFVGGSVVRSWRQDSFHWERYTISRTLRLWLVLIPALVLTVVLDWIGRTAYPLNDKMAADAEIAEHSTVPIFLGNAFFLQAQVVPTYGSNGALWSLAFEFAYYLLFPLILIGVLGRGRSVLAWLGFAGVAAGVVLVSGPFVLALFGVWLLGALVAWQEAPIRDFVSALGGKMLGAARMVTVVVLVGCMGLDSWQSGGPDNIVLGSIATGAASTVLLCLLLTDWQPRNRAAAVALKYTGGYSHSSYSLYASHPPILTLMTAALIPVGAISTFAPDLLGWGLVVGYTLVLVVCGWVFARLTERHNDTLRRAIFRVCRLDREPAHAEKVSLTRR